MNTIFSLHNTPEETRMGIVERMRKRRKEKGFSQQKLASKAGVSLGSLKRFEQTGEISLSSLIRIAFALGYEDDFEQLFSRQHFNSIQEIIDAQH